MLKSQKGVALVITLVMLAMLSMLGIFALNSSSTDLSIAGNYRTGTIAFYNCNEIEAYGPNNQMVLQAIVPNVVNSFPAAPNAFQQVLPLPAGVLGEIWYRVEYICSSQPLSGKGEDSENGVAYHFLVTIIGRGPNNSECVSEAEIIRSMPSKPLSLEFDC